MEFQQWPGFLSAIISLKCNYESMCALELPQDYPPLNGVVLYMMESLGLTCQEPPGLHQNPGQPMENYIALQDLIFSRMLIVQL